MTLTCKLRLLNSLLHGVTTVTEDSQSVTFIKCVVSYVELNCTKKIPSRGFGFLASYRFLL